MTLITLILQKRQKLITFKKSIDKQVQKIDTMYMITNEK